MISFFKKIFQKKEQNNEKNLISILINDHKNLIQIYEKIDKLMEKNDFINVQYEVKKFISEYNKHIVLEDTHLYIALEEKYKDKPEILNTIKNISKDMHAISKTITLFEKKHTTLNHDNKTIFEEEFKYIGQILLARIELEEERLYPLLWKR